MVGRVLAGRMSEADGILTPSHGTGEPGATRGPRRLDRAAWVRVNYPGHDAARLHRRDPRQPRRRFAAADLRRLARGARRSARRVHSRAVRAGDTPGAAETPRHVRQRATARQASEKRETLPRVVRPADGPLDGP